MKLLSLKLPPVLNAKLSALARERRTSKSAVVRDALEAYFAGDGKPPKLSALDLVSDLVGRFEGPKDLSTNPKYMRGFGR